MSSKGNFSPAYVCSVLSNGKKNPCTRTLSDLRKSLGLEEKGLCFRQGKGYLYSAEALFLIHNQTGWNFLGLK